MTNFINYELKEILLRLKLPQHMTYVEHGEVMIFCSACAEGKYLPYLLNNGLYVNWRQEILDKNLKLGDPEHNAILHKIAEYVVNDMSSFMIKHASCSAPDKLMMVHNQYLH